ncbi:MAG TPA: GAF domain-containing protein [Vicinamibacteria bacterium]|nr:GAF domain-containing protein [Vicinamibacteria bacterium]
MSAVEPDFDKLKDAYEERVRVLEDRLAQRTRELDILSAVAARIHGEGDERRILEIALDEITTRLGLTTAWIFMGEQREMRLRLVAWRGISRKYLDEIQREGLGECLCPEVFWTGHRMQVRNTTQCPRMPTIVEGLSAPVAHACVPMKFEEDSKGVLNVAALPGQLFTEDELKFLETIGHQLGLAVERARHLRSERLRNQEARAMAAVSKAIGGTLDVDAVLHAIGRTARELLGADRVHVYLGSDARKATVAHLSGAPHPELRTGQVLDLVAMGATLQAEVFKGRSTAAVDDWFTDPRTNHDLARRWGAASGVVLPLLARDRVLGVLVVTRMQVHRWTEEQVDVAEALAAQASVALENARLFEDARAAYEELKGAHDRILRSEKMAVLGTFASGLAHEVRNPLNSIALQLSILERRIGRCEAALAAEMADLTSVIREEIKRLDGLVGDFLLFSRTDRVQFHPASLEAIVEEVIRLVEPEAAATGVTLRHERKTPVPVSAMDAEKVKQVVMNLVRNALEAMPEGGACVVETSVADGRALLVVRDTGPGLPEGVDVYQLFVTTKPKGTGLGLSIVQQIVMQHGGDVAAASVPGEGTTFTVTLPVSPAGGGREEDGAA